MVRVLNGVIEGVKAEFATLSTTQREGTRFHEIDTNTWYILKNGVWQYESPINIQSSTVSTLYIPLATQNALRFGFGTIHRNNSVFASDGSMMYYVATDAAIDNSPGYMLVTQFATPELRPKMIAKFKVDNTTSVNAAFIGLTTDSLATTTLDNTTYIPSNIACVGIGYEKTDTNWHVFHNDETGALQKIDTMISRDTNVHSIIIQYKTNSEIILSFTDVNGTQLYGTTLTSEIPSIGTILGYRAAIVNNGTAAQYNLYIYDYVYLEKKIPTPTGVTS